MVNTILITDNSNVYNRNTSYLYRVQIDGVIIKKSTLPKDTIDLLNQKIYQIQTQAGEESNELLNQIISELKTNNYEVNSIIKNKSREDQLYGLLFANFHELGVRKLSFIYWLDCLLFYIEKKPAKINCIFEYNSYGFLKETDFNQKLNIKIKLTEKIPDRVNQMIWATKKFYYKTYKKLKSNYLSPLKERNNILVLLYKIPHHLAVLENFISIVSESKYALDIVLLEYYGNNLETKPITDKYSNVTFYEFKKFKSPYFDNHDLLINDLKKHYSGSQNLTRNFLRNKEVEYAFMKDVFLTLNPLCAIQLTSHDIGRTMADVARFCNVPSIQIDYALIPDSPVLESKIEFDVRACISPAVVDVWKKRKDKSHLVTSVGFCKLDSVARKNYTMEQQKEKVKSIGLDPTKKTILFASTWGTKEDILNKEKIAIINNLYLFCKENHWNLLVKKHPLEFDNLIQDFKNQLNAPFFSILDHNSIDLNDAIQISDLVTTQTSSIVLECLMLSKPLCFMTFSETASISLAGIKKHKDIFPIFNDFDDFKKYAIEINLLQNQTEFESKMQNAKDYILYKDDGLASQRVFNMIENKINSSEYKG